MLQKEQSDANNADPNSNIDRYQLVVRSCESSKL